MVIVQDRLISPVGMVNQFALQAETTGIGALGWVTIGEVNFPLNIFIKSLYWIFSTWKLGRLPLEQVT